MNGSHNYGDTEYGDSEFAYCLSASIIFELHLITIMEAANMMALLELLSQAFVKIIRYLKCTIGKITMWNC